MKPVQTIEAWQFPNPLEALAAGKKKMKLFSKVNIPQDAFIKVLKSGD